MKYAHVTTTIGALVLAMSAPGCGGGGAQATCPTGWTPDTMSSAGCRASSTYVDGVRSRVGTGAFGFAVTTTGNCQPGDSSTCMSRLEPGLQVRAFAAADVPTNFTCDFAPTTTPAASATIDANGNFEMTLAAGDYAFLAVDPVSHCPVAQRATVTSSDVTSVIFQFDHGAY